jgi:GntR family transcriptional regulator
VPEVNVLDEGSPLFVQIAEQLADDIAEGNLAEGERVPSTNELAAYYRINPATAAKGINVLIDDGLLEKRRGIGMFVAAGARDRLLADRRKRFAEEYVDRMVIEARRLGIDDDTLIAMVRDASNGTATSDTKTSDSKTSDSKTSDTKTSDTKTSDTTGGGAA